MGRVFIRGLAGADGLKLNLIDDGNYSGLGIRVDVEQPSDKPTPDETAVLKDGGFRYKRWRVPVISTNIPPRKDGLTDRLDWQPRVSLEFG